MENIQSLNNVYLEMICEENENKNLFDKIKDSLTNLHVNSINPSILFKCIKIAKSLSKDEALNFLKDFKKLSPIISEDVEENQSPENLEKNCTKVSSFLQFIKNHDFIFSMIIPFYDGLITEEELKVLPDAIKSIIKGTWRIKFS